jgi:hypothetical protein
MFGVGLLVLYPMTAVAAWWINERYEYMVKASHSKL